MSRTCYGFWDSKVQTRARFRTEGRSTIRPISGEGRAHTHVRIAPKRGGHRFAAGTEGIITVEQIDAPLRGSSLFGPLSGANRTSPEEPVV